MSWPSGYARPSIVRITSIYRSPKRLPDRALGKFDKLGHHYG
jgi:hypothetical protein